MNTKDTKHKSLKHRSSRNIIGGAVALGAAAALALAAPLAASAHVRVNPDQATPGSYATLTFRVPTESDTASTVKLAVDLPTDTPFTSVSYQPVPGWTTKVLTTKLAKPVKITGATVTEAPTKVIWTADPGAGIDPGQFQQFVISAGKVPDTGSVMLPAHQTYSDGSVVNWDQKTPASGGTEPEHPAPTLYINDAPPGGGEAGASTSGVSTSSTSGGSTSGSSTSGVGVGVGIAGLALAAIALVVSVFALTRRRTLNPAAKPAEAANPAGAGPAGAGPGASESNDAPDTDDRSKPTKEDD